MVTRAERTLDQLWLVRLGLDALVKPALLVELCNLRLRGCHFGLCKQPLPLIVKRLHAVPATARASDRRCLPTAAPHHATAKQPCAPPADVLATPALRRRFLQDNNRQGPHAAVVPLPARILGRGLRATMPRQPGWWRRSRRRKGLGALMSQQTQGLRATMPPQPQGLRATMPLPRVQASKRSNVSNRGGCRCAWRPTIQNRARSSRR